MKFSKKQVKKAKRLAYRALFGRWDRVKKYFWFILALQVYKFITYFTFNPSKGKLLEAFYLVNRYLDDVGDSDTRFDMTPQDRINYLLRKRELTLNPNEPQDEIEHLILYYQCLAKKRGEDFTDPAINIIDSMIFDAKRLGGSVIHKQRTLEENYHLLDEKGTVSPMLWLFKENPNRLAELSYLARAVRTYYNLRDLRGDIVKGHINISAEDVELYQLNLYPMLLKIETPTEIEKWFQGQAQEGLRLLAIHRKSLFEKPFRVFTRLVLWLMYERSARAFLIKIS